MLVMAVSDVMTLNFFWMVKDEGSWLDIGTTISHFVIGSLLSVFVAGLEFLSEVLISGVDVDAYDAQQLGGRERKDPSAEIDGLLAGTLKEEPPNDARGLANGHPVPNGPSSTVRPGGN